MNFHDYLAREHDVWETLAAIATTFALFVPLPAYVISTFIKRRVEAKERAYSLLERLDSGAARDLRDRVLLIIENHDLSNHNIEDSLTSDEAADLRQFMNDHELIGLQFNHSRLDRTIFYSMWRNAYLKDWDRISPYIYQLRRRVGSHLYTQWERAVTTARSR